MATNIFGQLNNELLNNQGSMQGGEELLGRIKALKKAAGLKQFRM